jgi:DUF4097 and DUF4098 domain-containing protein YvlB
MRPFLLAMCCLGLAACDDFDFDSGGGYGRYRQDFHFTYPLTSGGSVQLENSNGSVEISGWDKNTVEIEGTKYANTEERLEQMKIDVTSAASSISIRTVPPLDRHGNYGARYVIHVPRKAELASISSSNGAIREDGVEGDSHLKTSNGSVRASQIRGLLDVQTSNGSVEVSDVTGDTTLRTSNGSIRAEIRKGRFEARTSNGGIDLTLREADTKPIRLASSNGHIDLTMEAEREVHADTSNSSITVRMPGSSNVNLRAHTSGSAIASDFQVSLHGGTFSKSRMEGAIGSGGPLVDLTTTNGRIRLLKL